ncbi:hypothetical protein CV093_04435 [Oceanobacillus sp. 143]|nr:hypothetical protein CV093_04435 [Oceanobacillus sp. 143]
MLCRNIEEINEITDKIERIHLRYSISENNHSAFPYEIGIANNGTMEELFDLASLVETYRLFSEKLGVNLLSLEEELVILNLKKWELSSFLNGFDYSSPFKTTVNHVLTGLILGYPIESTIAVLIGQVY